MWIPSYGQIKSDSSISLTLNEINYFILQDTKEHYFELDDSLTKISYNICQKQRINDSLIIKDENLIINSQKVFIKSQDEFINSNVKQIVKLENRNRIKTKIIITETSFIIVIILIGIFF